MADKPTYGDKVMVHTSGNFGLFDPETGTDFSDEGSTETIFTRFVEAQLASGQLKMAGSKAPKKEAKEDKPDPAASRPQEMTSTNPEDRRPS